MKKDTDEEYESDEVEEELPIKKVEFDLKRNPMHHILKNKDDKLQELVGVIDIKNSGMVSSLVIKNQLFIGCRDGSLYELHSTQHTIIRELQTDSTISTIAEVNDGVLALGHMAGAGWAENRAQISIVRVVTPEVMSD